MSPASVNLITNLIFVSNVFLLSYVLYCVATLVGTYELARMHKKWFVTYTYSRSKYELVILFIYELVRDILELGIPFI